MKLSNKAYDIIKWLVITALPAINFAIADLGIVLDFNSTKICAVISIFTALIGTFIGISSIQYAKSKNGGDADEQKDK